MRLLGQLGQDSRWGKAMFNDPEMAQEMAMSAVKNEGKQWRPADTDWRLINEQLAQLIDLQKQQMRMQSSTPNRTIPDFPRPETAFTLALDRIKQEQAESELARVYDFVAEGQKRWREGHRPKEIDDYPDL